ncbi:MAG: DUF2569 family protein [Candidatus Omnitrophica bacterium]|nr:DUF2569 family protein [Candidatus Omnitrophota bacterium]
MSKKNLKGIRGWLLLYTIFISFRLFLGISTLIVFLKLNITTIIETLLIAIALISILIKSHYAKKINIGYLLMSIILAIFAYLDMIISDTLQDRANAVGAVFGAIVFSIVWILYLINSKRVKNTFVN